MSGVLEGKIAIVTGGASGIGAATGRMLAAEGASVVLADINADGADAVAAEIEAADGAARGIAADVGVPEAARAMVELAVAEFGGVDVLFNNAAALQLNPRDVRVVDLDLEVWNAAFQTNVTGALLGAKYAIPHMIERGGGSIVNTSSAAGLRGNDGLTSYAVTKSAIIGLSNQIAVQYGKQGIRSNVIAPGVVLTPAMTKDATGERHRLLVDHHLTPRVGRPDDVAAAVVYLASDAAEFVTGTVLPIDGGLTSYLPFVPARRRAAASNGT